MTDRLGKNNGITGANVVDAKDQFITRIDAPSAYYHMRKGNLTYVSRAGSRLVLRCINSSIAKKLRGAPSDTSTTAHNDDDQARITETAKK